MITGEPIDKLLNWRKRKIPDQAFMLVLSVIIGFIVGLAAVVIKNLVHFIQELVRKGFKLEEL